MGSTSTFDRRVMVLWFPFEDCTTLPFRTLTHKRQQSVGRWRSSVPTTQAPRSRPLRRTTLASSASTLVRLSLAPSPTLFAYASSDMVFVLAVEMMRAEMELMENIKSKEHQVAGTNARIKNVRVRCRWTAHSRSC